MRLLYLLSALLVSASVATAAADGRLKVDLPAPLQVHLLTNMRGHLGAIEDITRLLSQGRYGEAADAAEQRLGMSSMQAHGAAHMAPFMPGPMRDIGTAMHRAASRFAVAARDAEVSGDSGAVFAGLSEVMRQCVACHAAFRIH
jgi:hypothetical protein